MYHQNKITSILLAGLLLSGSMLTDSPQLHLYAKKTGVSVSEFAELLQKEIPVQKTAFSELRFSKQTNVLECDGASVGRQWGEWNVSDGELHLETEQGILSLDEAVEQLGCEVSKDAETGEVVVRSPFQNARLIVKSEKNVKPFGGEEIASGYGDLHVLQFDTVEESYRAYQQLSKVSDISYVCPDGICHCDGVLSSKIVVPNQIDTWGVEQVGSAEYCEWLEAEVEDLPEITVAVLDTGINTTHTWFENRIAEGGIATCATESGNFEDANGHGTHCAGIICQTTPDNVKILPVCVLNEQGYGTDLEVYCGMMYALEQGVDVISMSLGGQGYSPLFADASKKIAEADIPCCVAAGNDCDKTKNHTPANCSECITIAALNGFRAAFFSNYGEEVDFGAPGVGIFSAYIGSQNATAYMDGTSMATPFASGLIADLLSYDKTMTTQQAYDYLKLNAMKIQEDAYDVCCGWGCVCLDDFSFEKEHCAEPTFDIEMDVNTEYEVYNRSALVTLNCSVKNAKIYYTMDGSIPTDENGILYTEPFTVTKSCILQARSYGTALPSRIVKEELCIENKDIENPYIVENGVLVSYVGVSEEVDLSADFPDGSLTAIGDYAFMGKEVRRVVCPGSVTKIGAHAFQDIPTLNDFIGAGVEEIGAYAFSGDVSLGLCRVGTLRKIGRAAFCDTCVSAIEWNFSPELTEIADDTFNGSVWFSFCEIDWSQLTKIGARAFRGCTFVDPVEFSSLEYLGEAAFENCSLNQVTLSDNITTLPNRVFAHSNYLKYLSAPAVTKIGENVFEGVNSECYLEPTTLEVDLPFSSITKIGAYGLSGVRFTQPASFDSLTEIASNAFYDASGEYLTLPKLTVVPTDVLNGAKNLIYLPNLEVLTDSNDYNLPSVKMYALAVGDKLQDIRLMKKFTAGIFAGPQNSQLAFYAKRKQTPYLPFSDISVLIGELWEIEEPSPYGECPYEENGEDTYIRIECNEAVQWEPNCVYVVNVPYSCAVSFEVLSGGLYGILGSYGDFDCNDWYDVEADVCYLYVYKRKTDDSQTDTRNIFRINTERISLETADVSVSDCVYTGAKVKPNATVLLDDITLKEGVDYEVVGTSAMKECGRYSVKINGIGNYVGSRTTDFCIIPTEIAETDELLQEGTTTAEITSDKQQQMYRWIPDQTDYCFIKEQCNNTTITIYDENGKQMNDLCTAGYGYEAVTVEAGKQYRVGVSFTNRYETGNISFTLTSDYRLLDDCTLELDTLAFWNGSEAEPVFAVYDGETLLTEGVDYEVLYDKSVKYLGRAELRLKGKGKYVGILSDFFYTVYSSKDAFPSEKTNFDSWTKLELDTPYYETGLPLSQIAPYEFTAAHDGDYLLTQPDHEISNICTVIYAPDGKPLPIGTEHISLKAGETCTILCINNLELVSYVEGKEYYLLEISEDKEIRYVTVDGLKYRVDAEGAVLTEILTEAVGIVIPDVISDTEQGTEYPFVGVEMSIYQELNDNRTIYGELNGAVDTYCHESGLCFAAVEPEKTEEADVSGDGTVNYDDVLTLARNSAESEGMQMSETAFAEADLDADDMLTIQDVLLSLLKILE
ncbi:MAG: S8 family serine peptidase [Ruminococcus sp.]|nr:S8 family serine peptidase [Ruminococcus sp.]